MLRRLDAGVAWVVEHWLVAMNATVCIYVLLAFAAPLLLVAGAGDAAAGLYRLYSYACHQLPSHSWFPFGEKMAFCQRDTAIYGAMFVGGVAYGRRRWWTRGLPFWAYVLLSIPIALDGGAAALGWRESTPLLRTLTGALFGLATAWFVYPLMDRALADAAGGASREPTTHSDVAAR